MRVFPSLRGVARQLDREGGIPQDHLQTTRRTGIIIKLLDFYINLMLLPVRA